MFFLQLLTLILQFSNSKATIQYLLEIFIILVKSTTISKSKSSDVLSAIDILQIRVSGEGRTNYSLFFNQRTTTPQFTLKIELTTLYTFDIR
jgi:hypothetical protein